MNDLMASLRSLASTPLLWLAVTLVVFEGVDMLSRRSGRHPLCHPVLWSTPILIGILLATGTTYDTYATGTQMLTFLLGPATVALGVPLWRNRVLIRSVAKPLVVALFAGSLTAIGSAVAVLALFGAPRELLASIAPRAATTPVAMAVAAQLGGIPTLAAVIVLSGGVIGAMVVTPMMNVLGITDFRARGFAAGVAAHGFGTARAFQVDDVAGTFAGVGMALNAVTTAIILSLAALLFAP
ncbi:LrgB family protein [Lichenifustis flavocetrariae]|uniref:LrgB family protein n=1 Tax=Lichenifustis flavocetrariae TaxID=2949735 RepID=A0AA41Z712_9HYPH|nr:LrgB family protein [Lichenifustis flavocetrariae]MCW6510422.1 LrgB family protein [Lichenifustis flavocetrariae]